MRICFDLDDTLCTGNYKDSNGVTRYENCAPKIGAKDMLKRLRQQGHVVIIHTARGMNTAQANVGVVLKNVGLLTLAQLHDWGFEYDEIHFGKPSADLYVDDKAQNALDFWENQINFEEELCQ